MSMSMPVPVLLYSTYIFMPLTGPMGMTLGWVSPLRATSTAVKVKRCRQHQQQSRRSLLQRQHGDHSMTWIFMLTSTCSRQASGQQQPPQPRPDSSSILPGSPAASGRRGCPLASAASGSLQALLSNPAALQALLKDPAQLQRLLEKHPALISVLKSTLGQKAL